MSIDPESILDFWFNEIGPDRWFQKDPHVDTLVRDRFAAAHEQAVAGEFNAWAETPEGMIALLLLLDTFPRHIFRGSAQAYETDYLALDFARQGIIRHFDDRIDKAYKLFFYLPFSHSENIGDQRLATFYVRERTKEPSWMADAELRFLIVQAFGRFPHRNAVLGRDNTEEETEFLKVCSDDIENL